MGFQKMAKDDKELGEWIATSIVNTTTIKRFKHGFSIKKRGEAITEKIKVLTETTPEQMADIITGILTQKEDGIPPTNKLVGILPKII